MPSSGLMACAAADGDRWGDVTGEPGGVDYNEVRPHSAIGNEVPLRLHLPAGNPGQPAVG